MDTLLTEGDLAKVLQVSVRTIQDWRHEGRDPRYVNLGRLIRYSQRDIEAWIAGVAPGAWGGCSICRTVGGLLPKMPSTM